MPLPVLVAVVTLAAIVNKLLARGEYVGLQNGAGALCQVRLEEMHRLRVSSRALQPASSSGCHPGG
jgi:hypothetical protein